MPVRPASAAVAIAVGAAGCGSAMPAKDYRAALDANCSRNQRALEDLPRLGRERKLDRVELQERANHLGEVYIERIRKLDPPGDLQDPHNRMVEHSRQPLGNGTPDEFRRRAKRAAADYRALGARGCERGVEAGLRRLPGQ